MATTAENLPCRHRLSVTDYYRLAAAGSLHEDNRVELIEGEIIDMAPIGSLHAATVDELCRLLQEVVQRKGRVRVQGPVQLGEFSQPEPDLALLRPREDFYKSAHPQPQDVLLLIEVADTSFKYDREVKIPLYARHGIPEVWLVDLENRKLLVFQQPHEDGYQSVLNPAPPGSTALPGLPGINIDLSDLL